MCGIAGAAWTNAEKAVDPTVLQRMIDILRHRGPDGEGTYCDGLSTAQQLPRGVALGHRRLAIIDVACGQQPLSNEDGTVWVTFNGEIYNFGELRQRLESQGHQFRTHSDTETLVHLYEEEGENFISRLNGMFAFALWDTRRQQLLLARDRLGKKPLVYAHEPGRLLFASELKAILQAPGVPREIDPVALDEYLTYQYVPHPRTIFKGIKKLPPGHYAVYRDGQVTVRPYWQLDFNREEDRPAEEYAHELRELLTSAVEKRLQSEVPLGAFLSGGVDSTIIVGLMAKLMREPVRTFSIGFPVGEFDETSYAREAAQRFGTIHEEFQVRPDAIEILPRLVWHFDEPFADSSALPTWYVSQLTRQHVTVALTGDGGDELFAGYDRYKAVWLGERFDRLPAPLRWLGAGRFWQAIPSGAKQKCVRRRFKRFVEMLGRSPVDRYLEWISIFGQSRREELYADGFRSQLTNEEPIKFFAAAMDRCCRRDPITAVSLGDLVTYLPCDLMTKVDIASMAHSLECRQPFLDYRVVELAARIPIALKFRRGGGKRILRETFADLLPESIQRRPKMGFGVPLDHWFRQELKSFAQEILLDRGTLERGYFRAEMVRRLYDEHQQGRFNHGYRLWALLVFELWQRQWLSSISL